MNQKNGRMRNPNRGISAARFASRESRTTRKRAELIRSFSIDVSAHLYQLQHEYGLIESLDLVGQNGAKRQRVAYELNDELLDFWFTFILPNQRILQSHNTKAIRQLILRDYFPPYSSPVSVWWCFENAGAAKDADWASYHHGKFSNALFFDGHVSAHDPTTVATSWDPWHEKNWMPYN